MVCIALSAGFGSLSPLIVSGAIDALRANATWASISRYALAIILVAAVQGVFRFAQREFVNGAARRIENDVRNALYVNLLRQPPAFFDRLPTGDVLSRMSNDLGSVRAALGPGIQFGFNTVATLALAIGFMVWLDPWLTLWALIPLPLVSITVKVVGQHIHRMSQASQIALADLTTSAQENLAGARVVRAYGRGASEQRRFDERSESYVSANLRLARVRALLNPALGFLLGSSLLILLWVGGRRVAGGSLSLGDFVAFFMYVGMISWPLIAFGWITNLFQRAAAAMRRLELILHSAPDIDDTEADPTARIEAGEIAFRNVSFAYQPNRPPVFEDLDLRIPAGATIGVTGPTGSGKTTLARLIARLYEPQSGSIEIDGRTIRSYRLAELRRALGVVPQEPLLFSETIEENLRFGAAVDGGPPLESSVRIAGLERDIDTFSDGLQTIVGERGVTLSGGQKQRAALARALLANPVILVLDDAFSAVDTETEERILGRIQDFMRTRTTIVISHRVSTLRNADEIVVLDDGGVVERGSHEELLATGGRYAELYRRQQLEAELESG